MDYEQAWNELKDRINLYKNIATKLRDSSDSGFQYGNANIQVNTYQLMIDEMKRLEFQSIQWKGDEENV